MDLHTLRRMDWGAYLSGYVPGIVPLPCQLSQSVEQGIRVDKVEISRDAEWFINGVVQFIHRYIIAHVLKKEVVYAGVTVNQDVTYTTPDLDRLLSIGYPTAHNLDNMCNPFSGEHTSSRECITSETQESCSACSFYKKLRDFPGCFGNRGLFAVITFHTLLFSPEHYGVFQVQL